MIELKQLNRRTAQQSLQALTNPLIPKKIIVPPKPKILSMAYAKQAINAIVEKFGI